MGTISSLEKMFIWTRTEKTYFIPALLVILLSYSVYFFLDENTINKLGMEDGFFEYLTALFFLIAAIVFLRCYFFNKKIIYLVFALIFFIGMGEEISWGQRLFNYGTPEYFRENNIQDEFNLHNLMLFDSKNPEGQFKSGLSYYLSVNFLYKFFWMAFGIILPIVYSLSHLIRNVVKKIRIPVPPIVLGSLFLVNWTVCKVLLAFFLSGGRSAQYYYTAIEISEFGSAFVFMILAAYFLKVERTEKQQNV